MSSRKRLGKNHASNWKTRWFAINRKSDPVAYAWQSPKRGWRQIWLRAWRTDWACAIFDKITAVYGQIDENESSVRKWLARKMPFTDKMVKNSRLSVKIQTFRTRFYGQMLQKESSPNLCVNYFFSRALVVQGMPLHPCLCTSTLEGAVKGAPLRTSKRFPWQFRKECYTSRSS